MDDLISRQAAIDEAKEWIDAVYFEENDKRERKAIECFIGSLKNMPSALVTCVNCMHCEHRNNEEPYCHHHAMVVSPDYFCADGEEGEWMP